MNERSIRNDFVQLSNHTGIVWTGPELIRASERHTEKRKCERSVRSHEQSYDLSEGKANDRLESSPAAIVAMDMMLSKFISEQKTFMLMTLYNQAIFVNYNFPQKITPIYRCVLLKISVTTVIKANGLALGSSLQK